MKPLEHEVSDQESLLKPIEAEPIIPKGVKKFLKYAVAYPAIALLVTTSMAPTISYFAVAARIEDNQTKTEIEQVLSPEGAKYLNLLCRPGMELAYHHYGTNEENGEIKHPF